MEHCRRRNIGTGSSDTDNNILQTKGLLQGIALLLRLDLAFLADFLNWARGQHETHLPTVTLQLDENKEDCANLIHIAISTNRVLQRAEG